MVFDCDVASPHVPVLIDRSKYSGSLRLLHASVTRLRWRETGLTSSRRDIAVNDAGNGLMGEILLFGNGLDSLMSLKASYDMSTII